MLGSFAVGKTSLVQRFVHSIFSDRYLSTLGVKISKKELDLDGTAMTMVLWDLEGKDRYTEVNVSYLNGAMGFFVVADGTRRETLDIAMELRDKALTLVPGQVPHMLLINKADRRAAWEISQDDIRDIVAMGLPVIETSAMTGNGVEYAFTELGKAMLGQ
jgi:small GTP-binding protein